VAAEEAALAPIICFRIASELPMITRIDHVMICVPDLPRGMEQYRKMGFNIHAGGVHPGKGTRNAIAFLQDDYIELLAIRDQAEHRAAAFATSSCRATTWRRRWPRCEAAAST